MEMLGFIVEPLIGEEWDLITWDSYVWEYHTKADNFDTVDAQGFISSEEEISPPLA